MLILFPAEPDLILKSAVFNIAVCNIVEMEIWGRSLLDENYLNTHFLKARHLPVVFARG